MLSKIKEVVFTEPSGRQSAFGMFACSLAMGSIYIYFGVIHDGPSISSLIMAVGFALTGCAESLPKQRQQMAGGLRLVAILLFFGLISLNIFALGMTIGSS